jgi:hypothetical protein
VTVVPPTYKVYVETSIPSRLTDYHVAGKSQLSEADMEALGTLVERADVRFVTSSKALDEFKKTEAPAHQLALRVLYRFMEKVETVPQMRPTPRIIRAARPGQPMITGPQSANDPLFDELRKVFDADDAEHIFQAIKADCDYFLTSDFNTILNRAVARSTEVKRICGSLKLVSPSQLLQDLPQI